MLTAILTTCLIAPLTSPAAAQRDFGQVCKECESSVAHLVAVGHDKAGVLVRPGTGFLIEKDLVLTNEHVVRDVRQVWVEFPNDKRFRGEVVRVDVDRDLATVKLSQAGGGQALSPLRLAARDPAAGIDIRLIGHGAKLDGAGNVAGGLNAAQMWQVAGGSVSKLVPLGTLLKAAATFYTTERDRLALRESPSPLLWLDLTEPRRGMSGAPVLNRSGEVVGVFTGRMLVNGRDGYWFALSPSLVRDFLNDKDGKQPPKLALGKMQILPHSGDGRAPIDVPQPAERRQVFETRDRLRPLPVRDWEFVFSRMLGSVRQPGATRPNPRAARGLFGREEFSFNETYTVRNEVFRYTLTVPKGFEVSEVAYPAEGALLSIWQKPKLGTVRIHARRVPPDQPFNRELVASRLHDLRLFMPGKDNQALRAGRTAVEFGPLNNAIQAEQVGACPDGRQRWAYRHYWDGRAQGQSWIVLYVYDHDSFLTVEFTFPTANIRNGRLDASLAELAAIPLHLIVDRCR